MTDANSDGRDFIGYGAEPPDPQRPGKARVAVNICVNFEGGGERRCKSTRGRGRRRDRGTFETNDNRFDQNCGFSTGDDFARYRRDIAEHWRRVHPARPG